MGVETQALFDLFYLLHHLLFTQTWRLCTSLISIRSVSLHTSIRSPGYRERHAPARPSRSLRKDEIHNDISELRVSSLAAH